MTTGLLTTLTVVEILVLVAGLALFLVLLTRKLRSIATILGQTSLVIRAIQGDVCLVGAGAAILNGQLDVIAGALPAVAEKAESLPSQKATASARPAPQARAADPMIRRG